MTGAKAIPGVFHHTAGGLVPLYDFDGDGLLGGKDPKSFNMLDPESYMAASEAYDNEYTDELFSKLQGKRPNNYVLEFYDAQSHRRYSNEPTWKESDGGNFHKEIIKERLENLRDRWEDPSIKFYN